MNPVALITGATSAIGAAAALAFAEAGYSVALAARRVQILNSVAAEIEQRGGRALAVGADVTQVTDVDKVVSRTLARFGRLDVAFNNAGSGARPTPLADLSEKTFEHTMRVNVLGTFLCMRAEILAIVEHGGGAIVNMSSTAGLQGVAGLSPYCAGKYAIVGMSKAAALDYADKNVRINVVAPGPIATERIDKEQQQRIGQYVPVKRVGQPSEVAELVRWLCSPSAAFITGAVVPIDGGRLAGVPSFAAGS
ncbi:MAG TPA: SDR family oxidoreductase [Candidatus Baltobacteraceae bacterium]|nr:SDR family oxidoreductase [Candidatus Baltobacteraceae bacterium]